MTESPFVDSGFAVPVFSPRDNPIACLNKAMAFLTAVASSRFPTTNNQLKTSLRPRNLIHYQRGRVTVQQVQGRQGQNYSGEGHMARQCTQPKENKNASYPGIQASQAQKVFHHNAAFQTEDLDTYDSDCDDLSTAQAVLMANISNYGSDNIFKNLFYLKKAQRIKPTLYDGCVISEKHDVIPVVDDEETLILEELNRLTEDFGKCFSPQQELSAKQAFWFRIVKPSIEPSYTPPVIVDVPSELPKIFKDQFDLIKRTRVCHKEQSDTLINKLNLKSMENEDLKAQIQDKVFVITSLKNDLRKSKGKEIVENVVHIPSATTFRNTQEQANILQEIVKQAKVKQPLDSELDLACKYATRIQELLVYVQDTCPNAIIPSAKKVKSSNTSDSNTPVLSSTGVKCSTSNCGSKPPGNKKNDRISQTPSRNKKNKVEAQPRKVNKLNRVVKPVCDVDVKHSLSGPGLHYMTPATSYKTLQEVAAQRAEVLVDSPVSTSIDQDAPSTKTHRGGSSSEQHTHQPTSPITEGFLTKKEYQQLLQDEEVLRETLEEQARVEKELEERI
ncbi:hypothetical protein Tco_0955100 [Tanacetum coccineum]|uniref:Uncharacterized protein n=1 Tax=Tanacetum coccineum TaxID=301880 RepID=A0ABQ5E6C2_9ASTR